MKASFKRHVRSAAVTLLTTVVLISLTIHLPPSSVAGAKGNSEGASPNATASHVKQAESMRLSEAYGKLPMRFEANEGQADAHVKFLSRGSGYTLLLSSNEATLALYKGGDGINTSRADQVRLQGVVRMLLEGANKNANVEGDERLQGRSNYLIGGDRSKWQTNIPTYARVKYGEVYPGIDMVYYGMQKQLEYDFIVNPQADPNRIRLSFEGAEDFKIDARGDLVLKVGEEELTQRAPQIYQESEGGKQLVEGHYVLKGAREVGFEVASYDRSRPLVIDPRLVYATLYGGEGDDFADGIAVDRSGNAYITGSTLSLFNLPVKNPFQGSLNTSSPIASDVFVAKLNPAGTDLVYSTYLGSKYSDEGNAIAVTSDGKACITGVTDNPSNLSDFPLKNPFQAGGTILTCALAFASGCQDDQAFVTVLTASGNDLFYSTLFGGTSNVAGFGSTGEDRGTGIAVDASNKIYITGTTDSNDLPTKNAFQSSRKSSGVGHTDAFVAKFDPAQVGGGSLLYSSYFGGSGDEEAHAIAVDSAGNAYIVGGTRSTDLPTRAPDNLGPIQKSNNGDEDAYVAKFDPTNSSGNASLVYSTYFGGVGQDAALAVAVDSFQRAYITGDVRAGGSFPIKNAFQTNYGGGAIDAFIAKLNANGSAIFYSTFLGGSSDDVGSGIAVDAAGNAYVTGRTAGGVPEINGLPANILAGSTFIIKLGPEDNATTVPERLYADTFKGSEGLAIALDPIGNVYIAGFASPATLLQTTPGAFQSSNRGDNDAFVVKIGSTFPDSIGTFRPSTGQWLLRNTNSAGTPDIIVTFGQVGDQPVVGDWDGNGVDDLGVFRPSTGQFILRLTSFQLLKTCFLCNPVLTQVVTLNTINFGQSGDRAVVGDWNGDGIDTPGVFRPSTGQFLLTNGPNTNNTTPPINSIVPFGRAGDEPVAGDWNGDGIDTVGVLSLNGSECVYLLTNNNATIDVSAAGFCTPGEFPLAVTGDWNGDGVNSLGVFSPSLGTMFITDKNATLLAQDEIQFNFGLSGDIPVAGDWDGKPANTSPNSGVNDPAEGSSRAGQVQTFTTTCSDPDGWHDIHTIDFKVARSLGAGGGVPIALWVQFDENRNVVRFYDPDAEVWSESPLGSTDVLSSRYAELRMADTTVEGSGPSGISVQIHWSVVFKSAAVMNNYKQFLKIRDDAGVSTSFDKVGSWSVIR